MEDSLHASSLPIEHGLQQLPLPALPRSGRSLFRQQYRMFFHCYNSWRLRAMWDRRVRVPFPDDIFQKLLQTVQLLISALMQPVC